MSTIARPVEVPHAAARLSVGAPGPVLLVVGVCVATWLSFAVAPADAALFLGYALAFNVLPGCAAFVATARPARLGVRELAVGWGLGYALEAGAFVLTAATGHRDLLPLYPVAVLVLAAPGLWTLRHRFAVRRPAVAPAWTWGAAGVAVAAVLLTADGFFTQAPMPSSAPAVDYYPDVMAHLGFAAEALHHWPIEVPGLAGVRLHYYFLANTHMAAISQVTGIELPAVGLRLYLVPMLVLVPVQLVALARAVGATAWTGVVAGALVLLLGSTDPLPTVPTQLLATFPLSPSFLMGTIVWLPILILLCEALDRRPEAVRLPALVLVGVPLLIVCEGAKATSLPLTVCALALVAVWAVRRDRSRLPLIVGVGAACCAVIVLFNVVLYHGMTNSLGLHPLGGYLRSEPFRLLDDRLHHSPLARVALYPLAFVLGTLRLLIALLPGLLLLGLRGGLLRRPSRVLLLGAFLTGVGAMLLLTHPGESQLYFFYPGYIAGAVLSSAGLVAVLGPMVARIQVARTWVLAGAALAALVLIIDMPVWDQTQKKSWGTLDGGVTYPHANANMTPQLYAGYRWIRDHTDTDDVLAVSNLFADQRHSDPRYCEPPAFAERRTLVSCPSDGTSEYYGRLKGDTERFVLTQAIFANADRDALRFAVQKYGVRWLVADRIHTQVNPKVSELGRIAYKNSQITVIAVPRS